MLQTEHGNADMSVAAIEKRRRQAIHFVAEDDANGKMGLPIEDVQRAFAGFDCRDFVALVAQALDGCGRVLNILPRTRVSAPRAVFEISFLGGLAVIPLSNKRSIAAPSAVRKNAPTLYMLRTLSSRMVTGRRSWS